MSPRVKPLEYLTTYATDEKSSLNCSESILNPNIVWNIHSYEFGKKREKLIQIAAVYVKITLWQHFANFKFFVFHFFCFTKSFFFPFLLYVSFVNYRWKFARCTRKKNRVNEWSYNRDQYMFLYIYCLHILYMPSTLIE